MRLTEDGSGCIVTGETGLAHTRSGREKLAFTFSASLKLEFEGNFKAEGFVGVGEIPIVNNESSDFLYTAKQTSARP